jgi:hypothetical protein
VDDVRDRVLVERLLDGVQVGDVTADARDPLELVLGQGEGEARRLLADVEADHVVLAVQQRADRPGADRAEGAGHQIAAHRSVAPSEADPTRAQ